jgi:ABC-2 type transport system permease protein
MTLSQTPSIRSYAEHGGRSSEAIAAIVKRSMLRVRRMPSAFVPSLVMPVFQLIAFSGAFGFAVTRLGIPNALDWYVPLNAIQGASFGALGVSFALINDMQTGFFDRLRMAPTRRWVMIASPMAAAIVRSAIPVAIVILVGFIGGMNVPGGIMAIVCVIIASIAVGLSAAGFALGLTFRMRNIGAATLTQFAIFFTIFLSTSQVPLAAMAGWLRSVARINPMTNVLRFARQGFLGDVTWDNSWGGLIAMAAMLVLALAFAFTGIKSYEK